MRRTSALLFVALYGCNSIGKMVIVEGADASIDAGIDAASGPCDDQRFPDGGVCLVSVTGKVVDDTGAGLAGAKVTVCGSDCHYGTGGADGSFVVKVGQHVVGDRWAVEVHGRPDRVSYFVPLPTLTSDEVSYPRPFIDQSLPKTGPAIAMDNSAQSLVAGDVTMTLVAGTVVSLDVEDVVLNDLGRQLRALTIADPKTMPFVDPMDPPLALFGFAPFESTYAPAAQLAFKNTTGLAAGSPVDVFGEAGLYDPVAAGTFNKVATAHVSMDGKRIAMDPGQGVTTLRWLALRKGN